MIKKQKTIPMNWVETELGKVIEFKYGKALPAKKRDNQGYPVYGSNGIVGYHSEALIQGPALIIGRKGSIGEVHLSEEACSPIDTTYYVDQFFDQDPIFWLNFLKILPLKNMNRAVALPGLNRNEAYALKIQLPPPNEQKRIANRIKSHQVKTTRAKKALETAKPLLDKLRQSILASAFRGELTADWRKKNPDVEPASVLLERIRVERRKKWEENELAKMRTKGKEPKNDKWKSKYKEPELVDTKELPELPDAWYWASLEQILEYTTSGSRGWAKYYSEHGPLFIRAQNLKFDYLDLQDVAHVNLPEDVEGKRTKLKPHDLLITITGANVTKAGFVEKNIGEAYISQHVALCRLVNPLLINYIYFSIISSEDGRKQLEKAAYGLGKPGLNLDNIKSVFIPIASYEEIQIIVQRIKSEFLFVDSIEKKIKACLHNIIPLNQTILQKAFSGQLVSQDSSDEPATNLLERIRNEIKQ